MPLIPLLAMIRKDLRLFFADRRSVIVSFAVPIAIAAFFGSIFSGPSNNSEPARISIAVVDHDGSAISKAILASLQGDRNLNVTTPAEQEARDAVKAGRISVGVIFSKGFGEAAGKALVGGAAKPDVDLIYDPSRGTELAMVRGVMTQHILGAVSRAVFGDSVRLTLPYQVHEEAMTAGPNVAYSGYAHSFGGFGIQFLLFAMANLGVEMLLERQRGLWKRLRSAPVSRFTLLAGKALSGAIISLLILAFCFLFAIVVFKVRIQGSIVGFFGVAIACSIMASTFGLLVAALGNSPATARGVTTLAVLMMVMLGGAWVPTFIFPAWLQRFTLVVPVRWAVDGLDATTWRGVGLAGALTPIAVLLAFAAVFAVVAASRFKWEEA
jgi:ABC-2 type transport system permease protein